MTKCCTHDSEQTETLLKEAGFNITTAKKKILGLFLNSNGPLSAGELLAELSEFNESTIFRNLNQLKEANLIVEIDLDEGFKRYEVKPKGHHHHHVKCNSCGRIDIITKCDLEIFNKQLKKLGYKNITHKIEFFGNCPSCLA